MKDIWKEAWEIIRHQVITPLGLGLLLLAGLLGFIATWITSPNDEPFWDAVFYLTGLGAWLAGLLLIFLYVLFVRAPLSLERKAHKATRAQCKALRAKLPPSGARHLSNEEEDDLVTRLKQCGLEDVSVDICHYDTEECQNFAEMLAHALRRVGARVLVGSDRFDTEDIAETGVVFFETHPSLKDARSIFQRRLDGMGYKASLADKSPTAAGIFLHMENFRVLMIYVGPNPDDPAAVAPPAGYRVVDGEVVE